MKRSLLLLLFALPLLAPAQQTFHAGLIFGINGSQVQGDTYSGFNKLGLVGGAFVSTDPEQKFFGRMEMQYTMKGSRHIPNPDKGDYRDYGLYMNYIEVPFLACWNYKKLYFETGITGAYLVNVRESDPFGSVTPSKDFRKWESAFVIGGGIKINEHWSFDFRSTNSLFPVRKFLYPIYYSRWFVNIFNKGMYHDVVGFTMQYHFGKTE